MIPKIAILHTDHPAEWNKPWKSFGEMAIKLIEEGRRLENDSNHDIEYKVFDIYHRKFPYHGEIKRENGYVGIYITGSRYDSFDTTTPWINEFRVFLRTILVEEGYPPIAGVCFGHQMIASALDCKVSRNPRGLEIGITPVTLNEVGIDLFGGSSPALNLSEMHYDIVRETPQGYLNWGSSPLCERQGFYKPKNLISFQGHPEFTTEASQALLEANKDKLPTNSQFDYEKLKAQNSLTPNDGPFFGRYIWKLFKDEI